MENNQPLVSIAVVSYQNDEFIGACIQSILSQTYSNIEIIIADDGSHDQSQEIIKSYAFSNKKIKTLLSSINRGVSYNLNLALDNCQGKYICMIAGDDMMYPDKIQKQVFFLENNRSFGLCFHNVDVYDTASKTNIYRWLDKYLPTRCAEDALFIANWFFKKTVRKTPSGSWFGRASYVLNGRNDTRVSRYHEFIFAMGMHAKEQEAKWHCLEEVLGVYRVHQKSLSNEKQDWFKEAEDIHINYALAAVKFPQFGKQIHNEAAYWWFVQLLYNQVPEGLYRKYSREFVRNFGIGRYSYLVACKILLGKTFAPVRKIFR